MSLRLRLSVVVALAVAPPLALVAWNTYHWRDLLDRQAREEVLSSAQLVSAELRQLMEGSQHLMMALVKHPAVPYREKECAAYFARVLAETPIYRDIAIIDNDGKARCSTASPAPTTADARDQVRYSDPVRPGQFTVSAAPSARVARDRSIRVAMPYRSPDGRHDGLVVLNLDPRRVAQEFSSRDWKEDRRLTVLDRDGALLFSIPQWDDDDGARIARQIYERTRDAPAGTFVTDGEGNGDEIVGFVPFTSSGQNFIVAVGLDRDVALAPVMRSVRRNIVGAAIAILLAMLGTWLASHFLIRRPVLALVDTAKRREAGDITAHFPRLGSGSELGQLSCALAGMSEKIDRLLEQKEFLMREVQHRVMNSLNILSSLLGLQAKHVTDPGAREQLQRARDRILSMGDVYRYLYRADGAASVDLGELLKTVCEASERAYGGVSRPSIICTTEPLQVTSNQATSLAVLTHELITNALKHAYPGGEPGPISVRLSREPDGVVTLRIADRGRGVPAYIRTDQPDSLGLKVVMATARQFGGVVTINRLDPGTEFIVRFPPGFDVSSATESEPDAEQQRKA